MTSSPAEPRQMADGQVSPRRVFMASAVGSAIEFYDFYIYGTAAALVFPAVFFPNLSHSLALFASIATFSTAFLARPIGAALFGHYGDRFSRKGTLVVTLITMGLATMAVGLVPGAATIGAAAPTAIVILRLVQGLAVGGEWSGAALLSAEYSPSQNRGRAATAVPIGTSTGLLLSSLVFLIVSLTIGEDSPAFLSWGWRVPFIASGLLVAVGLYIRLQIAETPQFVEAKAHHQLVKSPLRHVITESPRTLVLTSGTMLIIFTLSFMTNTYFPGFARSELHFSRAAILAAGALGAVVLMVSATAGNSQRPAGPPHSHIEQHDLDAPLDATGHSPADQRPILGLPGSHGTHLCVVRARIRPDGELPPGVLSGRYPLQRHRGGVQRGRRVRGRHTAVDRRTVAEHTGQLGGRTHAAGDMRHQRRLYLRYARNVGRIGTLNRSACDTQLPVTDSR